MINEKQIIKSKIIESATAQISEMLRQHFDQITGAAAAGFIYDEDTTEPNAKVGFSIEWDSLSTSPTVYVKMKYTTSYKDESEAVVNSPQTELVLVEKGGAA
jgi:hypothetical protein